MGSPEGGYGAVSLWLETCGDSLEPGPPLTSDIEVDVAIVGAGFTGLWTAYYLSESRPDLTIAIVEREIAGFGASGRNGGWASALFPSSMATIAKQSGREGALAQHAAMRGAVDEVIRAAAAEGIDAGIAKGGTVALARTPIQLARAHAAVDDAHAWGQDEVTFLDEDAARARVNAVGTLGAMFTPDCAAIQPAKLVRGLAKVVKARGVAIYEGTPAQSIAPHRIVTPGGTVTADFVVRATEGYTPTLEGQRRAVAPVYSLIVATAPLPEFDVGRDWARAARDVYRFPPSHRLRAAHRGRSAGVWRSRSAVPLWVPRAGPSTTLTTACTARCGRNWWRSSPCLPAQSSLTDGVETWASRGTGTRLLGWIPRLALGGQVATLATACPPPTLRGGPCGTSSWACPPN